MPGTAVVFTLWITRYYQRIFTACRRALLRLPPLQYCAHTLMLVRFTRHLGLALNAGIPIQHALTLTAEISTQPAMVRAFKRLHQAVTSGKPLHTAMAASPVFPTLIQQMIKVGEESGSLDSLLAKSADLLEAELHTHLSHLTALLEPLIMVILGALIGGLVVGIIYLSSIWEAHCNDGHIAILQRKPAAFSLHRWFLLAVYRQFFKCRGLSPAGHDGAQLERRMPHLSWLETTYRSELLNLWLPFSHCPRCKHTIRPWHNIPY